MRQGMISGGWLFGLCLTLALTRPMAALDAPKDLGVLDGYTQSIAYAVNASGQVVGQSYKSREEAHAFLWLPAPAYGLPAGMNDLGAPGGFSCSLAMDINLHGQVIGLCWNGLLWESTSMGTFLWLPVPAYGLGAGMHVIAGLPGETFSMVADISDTGYIVGNSGCTDEITGWYKGFRWYWGTSEALAMEDGTSIMVWGYASDHVVNDSGQVIGYSYATSTPVLWDQSTTTSLSDGSEYIEAAAINSQGEVVGRYGTYAYDVFLWLPKAAYGLAEGLHCLAADAGLTVSNQIFAYDTNDAGQIVGSNSRGVHYEDSNSDGLLEQVEDPAFVWIWQNGAFRDLGTTIGDGFSFGINAQGQVAGYTQEWNADTYDYVNRGYFWSETTGLQELQGLGGTNTQVLGIGDGGQIVGSSSTADGSVHACLWECPEPESALAISEATLTARNPKVITATVMITNPGDVPAYDVTVTSATLDGVDSNSPLPLVYGTLKPGATKKCTLQFKRVPAGEKPLTVLGTSSLGAFFTTQTVTVP